MKRGAPELVAQLSREGLVFRAVTVTEIGDYAPADADWNYKDVPHLNHVHRGIARAVIADVADDHIATVNFQHVLGLRLPIVLYNYSLDRHSQVYMTTFGLWVLVVETTFVEAAEGRTEVTTTYHVGCSRPLGVLFPVIRWLLLRNNRRLMEGDLPMRDRRGDLRRRGFRFARDDEGHGFEATMPLWPTHVVPPPVTDETTFVVEAVTTRLVDGPVYLGDDDHLGVRVQRVNGALCVFPRMCMHEGASLDEAPCTKARLRCPWHDKAIPPMASFGVGMAQPQLRDTPTHRLLLEGERLTVTITTETATGPEPSERDS